MDPPVELELSEGFTSADGVALKQYQYRPVDKSEIRCVRLDSSAGYLRGYLSTLDRLKGGFTALSYEWGSSAPTFQHAMWITDEHGGEGFLPMTENLSNAVKDLQRSPVQSKSFFIDQLCINQKDNKEKSIQVAGMSKVYKHADQVVCYLGPSGIFDSEALQLLRRLDAHFGEWFDALDQYGYALAKLRLTTGQVEEPFGSFRLSFREAILTKPLEEIVYESGWTRRLWMCQEVLLNKELTFLRGSKLIIRRSIFLFVLCCIAFIRGHDSLPAPSTAAIRGSHLVVTHKQIHISEGHFAVLDVMPLFSTHWECSDPRDKIYGVLGLIRDNFGIVPDYEADVADIYTDFAWRCIQGSQSLDIFDHILQEYDSLKDPGNPTDRQCWPTWVPRFEVLPPRPHISYATGSIIPKAKVDLSQRMLKIKGWQVGEIETLCGRCDIPASSLDFVPWTSDSIRQIIETIEAARASLVVKGVQEADSRLCYGLMNDLDDPVTIAAKDNLPPDFAADRALQSLLRVMRLSLYASLDSRRGSDRVILDCDRDRDGSLARELLHRMEGRRRVLCITTDGKVIIATMAVKAGDIVTVLAGGGSVYVLRALKDDQFIIVGPAFAHGYMEGETIHDPEWNDHLRYLIRKLLKMNLRAASDVSYDSHCHVNRLYSPDLEYCIGCMTLSRSHAREILTQEDGVEKIRSKAIYFLRAAPDDQIMIVDRAIMIGFKINTKEDFQWRQKWWNMIEQWIEAGMIRAPKWMAKLRTFTIR